MLNTVLRNLISNAIKFTDNGRIIISANVDSEQSIVNVDIADTGVGISDETKPKLFEIAENVSTQGTAGEVGTGLGLILCREFIQKMGGDISVLNNEPKGVILRFTLKLDKISEDVKITDESIVNQWISEISDYTYFLNQIRAQVSDLYSVAALKKAFKSIDKFANALSILAKTNNHQSLIDFSQLIQKQVFDFDIDNLQHSLNIFGLFIQNLEIIVEAE